MSKEFSLKEFARITGVLASCLLIFFAVRGYSPSDSALPRDTAGAALAKPLRHPLLKKTLPPAPGLSAHAYFAKIIGFEEPLLASREDKRLAPASIIKLLAALLAVENLSPTENIFFSEEVKRVSGVRSAASAGEFFIRDDVIRLALIQSANDAAQALADAVGRKHGGATYEERIKIFVALMNSRAKELGMIHSEFINPTGLDPEQAQCVERGLPPCWVEQGNASTVRDLARLAEFMWQKYPRLWEITRSIEAAVYSSEGRVVRSSSTNELLKEFPGLVGGKTGSTNFAKQNLLLLYPITNDATAVIVILGSGDRFEDGRIIIRWLESAFVN